MNINGRLVLFTLLLVALATACKFFFGPDLDWSGFTPVIAIALFSGFIIKQRDWSFMMPLFALFISDVIIHILYLNGAFPYAGFYSGQLLIYLFVLSATLIGWWLKGRSNLNIFLGAVASPTVFFLLSNLSVWMGPQISYSKDFSGLMECYVAGLPFYKNGLMAMALFLPVILIAYNFITRDRWKLTLV